MINFNSRRLGRGLLFLALSDAPGMIPSQAAAQPMTVQELSSPGIGQRGVQGIQPYFGQGLDQPFDQERWQIEHSRDAMADRPEVPTGIIASIGRFGLKIDSSDDGPAVNGLAWSPSARFSIVASGKVVGGLGANLSVRLRF
jgi:hypothetical protein